MLSPNPKRPTDTASHTLPPPNSTSKYIGQYQVPSDLTRASEYFQVTQVRPYAVPGYSYTCTSMYPGTAVLVLVPVIGSVDLINTVK